MWAFFLVMVFLFKIPLVALTKCLLFLSAPGLLLSLAGGLFCSGMVEGQDNQLCWDQAGGAGALLGVSDFAFLQ